MRDSQLSTLTAACRPPISDVMGKLVAGALVASLGWGAAWWLLRPMEATEPAACDDRCGEGTQCEDGLCVIETQEAVEEPTRKRKRRRKRRKRRGGNSDEGEAESNDPQAPRVDDSHIPAFSNDAQALDLNGGSERLTDNQVSNEVRKLTPRFQRCIVNASVGDAVLRGKVKIKARISGKGKVSQVSASAPSVIRESGAIPCIRKAVYDHRFPSYDGPSMGVDLSFEVD
ncbi:MAG TPA: hypothetical protein ENJ18_11170 [Nannocystis exedens]|nr:hypothetical protein [Nannocystis exedens]